MDDARKIEDELYKIVTSSSLNKIEMQKAVWNVRVRIAKDIPNPLIIKAEKKIKEKCTVEIKPQYYHNWFKRDMRCKNSAEFNGLCAMHERQRLARQLTKKKFEERCGAKLNYSTVSYKDEVCKKFACYEVDGVKCCEDHAGKILLAERLNNG